MQEESSVLKLAAALVKCFLLQCQLDLFFAAQKVHWRSAIVWPKLVDVDCSWMESWGTFPVKYVQIIKIRIEIAESADKSQVSLCKLWLVSKPFLHIMRTTRLVSEGFMRRVYAPPPDGVGGRRGVTRTDISMAYALTSSDAEWKYLRRFQKVICYMAGSVSIREIKSNYSENRF